MNRTKLTEIGAMMGMVELKIGFRTRGWSQKLKLDPEQDDGLEQKLGHKLVQTLDSEQADGWSQHLEQ